MQGDSEKAGSRGVSYELPISHLWFNVGVLTDIEDMVSGSMALQRLRP